MPELKGKIAVSSNIDNIYTYLKTRHKEQAFIDICMQTKGYVPPIKMIYDNGKNSICFSCSGRDTLTKMKIGKWTWSYDLKQIDENTTEVEIHYSWSVWLSIISWWTISFQAANEMGETALALVALAK